MTDPPPVVVQRLLSQAWDDWAAGAHVGWYASTPPLVHPRDVFAARRRNR
ncbi:hypothetical protein [Fimbriiglobus ruber]|uniref:Uncharacterized protein n=1 Tax=Fimbriiglobus ruber TaxID=1908690 RepID=A0A225DP47_9BACT|nr:hypothetical protein [Fimbriiglobus ruber]OWK40358.1 hypothetical protein FRUB_05277 [Fimbriiglobus ruber]